MHHLFRPRSSPAATHDVSHPLGILEKGDGAVCVPGVSVIITCCFASRDGIYCYSDVLLSLLWLGQLPLIGERIRLVCIIIFLLAIELSVIFIGYSDFWCCCARPFKMIRQHVAPAVFYTTNRSRILW